MIPQQLSLYHGVLSGDTMAVVTVSWCVIQWYHGSHHGFVGCYHMILWWLSWYCGVLQDDTVVVVVVLWCFVGWCHGSHHGIMVCYGISVSQSAVTFIAVASCDSFHWGLAYHWLIMAYYFSIKQQIIHDNYKETVAWPCNESGICMYFSIGRNNAQLALSQAIPGTSSVD